MSGAILALALALCPPATASQWRAGPAEFAQGASRSVIAERLMATLPDAPCRMGRYVCDKRHGCREERR